MSDLDCKGDRLCDEGMCISPGGDTDGDEDPDGGLPKGDADEPSDSGDEPSDSGDETEGTITVTYTSKDTSIGDVWGPDTATMQYDEYDDTLTFLETNFGATMYRAEGTVTNSDSDPAW